MQRTKLRKVAVTGLTALALSWNADTAEIGHYNGGVVNIRDFVVPDPGFYSAVYNYSYRTTQINDAQGNKISSITINPGGGPGVTLGLSVDVDMYALAPTLIWVTDIKPLGIKYGALIAPSFMNVNLDAALSFGLGVGGRVSNSSFGAGDLFVQPIWLGKTLPHWDLALAYGFYAPVGKYNATETVIIPRLGPVTVESPDNLGYGFWTQQIQGAVAWYPMTNKATAVVTALTWEINGKKQDFDITPGQNLTLTWGIDQMIPLRKDMTLLLDIGPAGYDTWQITSYSGSAANTTRDQVHAVGGQLGLTYVPWALSLAIHGFYEYIAQDRFQGSSFGITIGKKF